MWTRKYKPNSLNEYVGQKDAVEKFLRWIKTWKQGKALLLHGRPGTGKTCLIEAFAKENNYQFIELNASDFRSKTDIEGVIGQSMKQQSLLGRRKIFLMDEIDGLAGRQDLGGVGAIIKIIRESKFPVALTCNNPYDTKLKILRQLCELVEFGKIPVWDIERRLKMICSSEGITHDEGVIKQLARMSNGDLRSAINDLETICSGTRNISSGDLEGLGYRERERSIYDALKFIFKTKSVLAAKLSINDVDKDPDEIFWWIENNVANEYESPEELANAFNALSSADIFRKKIRSRQNWRLLSYMIDMMTGGVATSKKDAYRKFVKYQYPANIRLLGSTKTERKDVSELNAKFASYFHCSSRKFKSQTLPYLKLIFRNKKIKENLMAEFPITNDELKLLFRSGKA